MRHWTVYVWGLLLATTSCEQVGNKTQTTPQTDTVTVQTSSATAEINFAYVIPQSEKYLGTYITNGKRRGGFITGSALYSKETSYFYCYITARITNDSTIPMHIEIAFSKEFYHPTPPNGQRFRVFLLPETIIGVGQLSKGSPHIAIDPAFAKNIIVDDNQELRNCLDTPLTLNKTINPKEECIVNIGFLIEDKFDSFNPIPFALFAKDDRHYFASIPDSAINQVISVKNQLPLLLGLGNWHKKDYCIIPCGQISFSN
ncbi:MAG: hypothetical protein JWO44_2734 [Bacteroidetes bacterium]|nr:hypothetical protein [Bacteroidota bacterium]